MHLLMQTKAPVAINPMAKNPYGKQRRGGKGDGSQHQSVETIYTTSNPLSLSRRVYNTIRYTAPSSGSRPRGRTVTPGQLHLSPRAAVVTPEAARSQNEHYMNNRQSLPPTQGGHGQERIYHYLIYSSPPPYRGS